MIKVRTEFGLFMAAQVREVFAKEVMFGQNFVG